MQVKKRQLNNSTHSNNMVGATIWYTLSNIIQRGISVLTVPVFTRLLTTVEYGNYSVFLSWLEIFEILATFRLGWGGYVVGLTKFDQDRNRYTSSMQSLSILLTTLSLTAYILLWRWINMITGMDFKFTMVLFGILYALPAIQFWSVRQRVESHYMRIFAFSVFSSTAVLVAGSWFAIVSREKDFAVLLSRLIVQGSIGVLLIIYNCHKDFTFFDREYWGRALRFNTPLLPYYLSMVVLHTSDRIIIGRLVSTAAAAIYSVAYTLAMAMQVFSTSFNQAIQPRMFQQMKEGRTESIAETVEKALIVVSLLNILLMAFAPELVSLVAPAQYASAVWVVPPLAASVVVMFFYQHFINVEFYFEESKLIAIASIGAAVMNIGLNYLFIPAFGYMAAGYTTLVSYLLFSICHYVFMRIVCFKKNYEVKLFRLRKMTVTVGVALSAIALFLPLYERPAMRYVVVALLAVFVWRRRYSLFRLCSN